MRIRPDKEILAMYENIIDDMAVSPTAKETLEWVMYKKSTNECDFLFNLSKPKVKKNE